MSSEPEIVKLKNGSEEGLAGVRVLMMVLDDLSQRDSIVCYELVMVARDRNHQIFGGPDGIIATKLRDLHLLQQDNSMHDTTRNIILSAVTGEGFNMEISWPVAEEAI